MSQNGINIIKQHNFCVVVTNEAWPGVYFVHDRLSGARRLATFNKAYACGFSKHQCRTQPAQSTPESER